MPTITKYRTWCKSCKDWTFHTFKKDEEICTCGTIFTEVKHSEIGEEKILEQRLRYKQSQRHKFEKSLSMYTQRDYFSGIFKEESETIIIESDAGQKAIDDRLKELRSQEERKLSERTTDYIDNYSGLNRNDKCACGSGKKYKQCHQLIFRKDNIAKN